MALTLLLAAAVAAGASRPAAQQSASVRGRVEIGIPASARRPATPYTRTIGGRPLAPPSERQHVVVYLKDAQAQAVTPMKARILQRNETFLPRVVAVTVGSEVEFPNDDPIYHNVFSLSRVRQFNLGRYPSGETRSQRFDRPGIVKVFCDIHSHMSATVMVFDHPWFAIPDVDGSFTLSGVPPGERQITAWHERLGDTTINVRVEGAASPPPISSCPFPSRDGSAAVTCASPSAACC
jgi:plastocyanin